MKKLKLIFLGCAIIILFVFGCSSSKTRGTNNSENNGKDISSESFPEDFNLTPYREKLNLPPANESFDLNKFDIWYSYPKVDSSAIDSASLIKTSVPGYRVVVLSTDDLQTANELKSELFSKTNQKNIYLDFEPPFYKVKVGDFTSLQDANSLKFKLNQLGYKDARVISEDVNIVKQQQ